MKFSEVIGQTTIKRRLMAMDADGRVPHALLLAGSTGYGTLALAIAFASYLLGEREEDTDVHVEAMLRSYQHPDLHFVFPIVRPASTPADKKIVSDDYLREWTILLRETAYFTFEEWLTRMRAENQQAIIPAAEADDLQHKLLFKASQGGKKVSVVWMPERMHEACANKLLKLLEEPPKDTIFLLVSEAPQLLLETIQSRTQRLDVKPIDDEAMTHALVHRRGIDNATAVEIMRVARGNWLRAVENLESENERQEFHSLFVALTRMAYLRDPKGMKAWTDGIVAFGREKQRRFLHYFAEQLRENFVYNFHQPSMVYLTREEEAFSKNFAPFINSGNIRQLIALTDHTMEAIGQNANPRMQFFYFALRLTSLIRRPTKRQTTR